MQNNNELAMVTPSVGPQRSRSTGNSVRIDRTTAWRPLRKRDGHHAPGACLAAAKSRWAIYNHATEHIAPTSSRGATRSTNRT